MEGDRPHSGACPDYGGGRHEVAGPGWPSLDRRTGTTDLVGIVTGQLRIDKDTCLYIAGHRGLVGSAIWRKLESDGFTNLVGRSSSGLDLTDRGDVFDLF